jgi:hypothetical protein
VALFSARLDETGTDGRSPFTLVGGAVARPDDWDDLEAAWGALLTFSQAPAYHWKEFNDPNDKIFGKWTRFKRQQFREAQETIISDHTVFKVSVGVESAIHADVKRRMKGIKGFAPISDYSLCLRWLMYNVCEQLSKEDRHCKLSILVESGPWASGAAQTYERVVARAGGRRPGKHAHRLAGFATAPKGVRTSLEAADYIAGSELARLLEPSKLPRRAQPLSVVLNKPLLEHWYEDMIAKKEARRAFAASRKATSSPEQSS